MRPTDTPITIEMIQNYMNLNDKIHPGFSIDCVIITFHNNKLKILLNKLLLNDKWMLPGGYVYKEEDLDQAAYRILKGRTGVKDIYLEQFHTFGDYNRVKPEETLRIYNNYGVKEDDLKKQPRFITTGYFALVKYDRVKIKEKKEDICKWFNIDEVPELYGDHNIIIKRALNFIKIQIEQLPIGFEILPEKFTISELRKLYEAILGKELDRRNFQKKMLSSEQIIKLDERKETGTNQQPILFSFNKQKIKELIENYY